MINRRTFLQAMGGAACASLLPASSADGAVPAGDAIPIVDTHQHLWDLKRFRLPWLDGAGELNRSFLVDDYLKAAEGLNIVRAVYMEVAVEENQRQAEAEYVIDLCRRRAAGDAAAGPTVAAVIGGSPAAEGFPRYIGQFKDSPYVKGVRESLRRGSATDALFLRGICLLGELGMSFDLLSGPDGLADAAAVAEKCRHTRFVLDHCGNADPRDFRSTADDAARRRRKRWEEGVAALGEQPNVICKISGVLEAGAPDKLAADDLAPVVNYCLDRFGPERVVFATNWPVCNRGGTLRRWVEVLREVVATRPGVERRKLFHDNALAFYRLM